MKWIQYKIYTTTDAVPFIGDLLTEMGIPGFEVDDNVPLAPEEEQQMFTDIPAQLAPDDGTAKVIFYTEGENCQGEKRFYSTGSSLRDERLTDAAPRQSPEELLICLREKISELRSFFPFPEPNIEYSVQDDSQWKDAWKENFKPFRVADGIIIKPVWEDIPSFASPSDTILEIEPGSAFGTGTHETTKLCLLALRKHSPADATLLDAGCGSGILAISALLTGTAYAFCIDIDPLAVSATQDNARHNGLDGSRLHAICGNILEDAGALRSLCPEPFDIAVANILADVIIPLAGCIRPFIRNHGIFISSGILEEKAGEVEEALSRNHFTIIDKSTMGEWVCFTSRKEP